MQISPGRGTGGERKAGSVDREQRGGAARGGMRRGGRQPESGRQAAGATAQAALPSARAWMSPWTA